MRATAARIWDRPGLDRLRDDAQAGHFRVLAVLAPDRLARKYAYQVLLLEELRHAGCEVVFLQHPIGEDPHEQLLLQIQGAIAEYERYAEFGISLIMPSPGLCRTGIVQGAC